MKKICENCNEEITRKDKRGKYCSSDCSSDAQKKAGRISISCDLCGETFERRKSDVNEKWNFCTRKCQSLAKRLDSGEKFDKLRPSFYGTGMANYRERALKNYGKTCECCSYDEHLEILEVHHIDKNRDNNNLQNLIVICPSCHQLIHKNVYELKDRKLVPVAQR